MTEAWIIGSACTPCGRFADATTSSLAQDALNRALDDAHVNAERVDAVIYANALSGLLDGQESVRGQVALQRSRLAGRPVINVDNACASGATAFHLAWLAIVSGLYETVAVVAAEKMSHPDKSRAFRALAGAADVTTVQELPSDRSIFMDFYASRAEIRLKRDGWTTEDLAAVVVKNRSNAVHNPIAHYRQRLTIEEVLGSRIVTAPLTVPMCSRIGDGAAAVIVTSARSDRRSSVRILASAIGSCGGTESAVAQAAHRAYEQAAVSPCDIEVAEVHDATASAELEEYELLGFAPEGEGNRLIADGSTLIGGKLPVNPSGGLISRGHPVGATGLLQIVELTEQLQGRSGVRQIGPQPRIALAQSAGGVIQDDNAAGVVTILGST